MILHARFGNRTPKLRFTVSWRIVASLTLRIREGWRVILEELKKSLLPGVFSEIYDLCICDQLRACTTDKLGIIRKWRRLSVTTA